LEDTDIRAPFDGVVEQRHVAPGAYLQVGQSVVTLVKVNPWRFRASVPEREATAVQVGQRVTIQVEGEQRVLEAVIARISPSLEASNRALAIEAVQQSPAEPPDGAAADEPAARLRRGLFAEADVHVEPDARTLAVPRAAVREFAGVEKVWRVVDQQAAEQRVEVGRLNDAHAEILDGLAAGDVVVVEGFPKQAGPVEITQRQ
jgi:membrane fusion protein (multidrug efflux system)